MPNALGRRMLATPFACALLLLMLATAQPAQAWVCRSSPAITCRVVDDGTEEVYDVYVRVVTEDGVGVYVLWAAPNANGAMGVRVCVKEEGVWLSSTSDCDNPPRPPLGVLPPPEDHLVPSEKMVEQAQDLLP